MSEQHIAVVGCGTIGQGWAVVFARAGLNVSLWDQDPSAPTRAAAETIRIVRYLQDEGFRAETSGLESRVTPCATLAEAVEDAGFVFEAVPEHPQIKRQTFIDAAAASDSSCVLASSASALLPSAFLEGFDGSERSLVAHPFNPAYVLPLVELVPSSETDPSVVDRTHEFLESVGQAPIRIEKEIFGYVGNRIQTAAICEAMHLVAEGIVSPADLDKALETSLGLRWSVTGPLKGMDLNSQIGFLDYATKFGSSYEEMAALLGVTKPWKAEAIDTINRWCEESHQRVSHAEQLKRRDINVLRVRDAVEGSDA